ncbi:MAG: hypothetical protein ACFCUE_02295 [Candidatus Bathyarchaeia archaeon]|jgi:hypothetical protein
MSTIKPNDLEGGLLGRTAEKRTIINVIITVITAALLQGAYSICTTK